MFASIFSPETWENFGRNCLLVAGGFMAGYVGGWVLGFGVNKYVLRGKGPEELQKLFRLVCGLIVAIIVALMVFTGGGKGPGDGGPAGSGSGDQTTKGDQPKGDTPVDPKVPPKEPPPQPTKGATDGHKELTVTVRMLGGTAVEGEKAYQLGDDPKKLTIKELQDALLQKKKDAGDKGIRVSREWPGPDPITERSANWTLLRDWLDKEKIPY